MCRWGGGELAGPQTERFLRVAGEHLDDARVLRDHARFGGAVYLSGYTIECSLKALILATVPRREQDEFVRDTFTTRTAHEFEWLRSLYRRRRNGRSLPPDPRELLRRAELILLSPGYERFVDRRYDVRRVPESDVTDLINSAADFRDWCMEQCR